MSLYFHSFPSKEPPNPAVRHAGHPKYGINSQNSHPKIKISNSKATKGKLRPISLRHTNPSHLHKSPLQLLHITLKLLSLLFQHHLLSLQLHDMPFGKHQHVRFAHPRLRTIPIIIVRQRTKQRFKLTVQSIAVLLLDLIVIGFTFGILLG